MEGEDAAYVLNKREQMMFLLEKFENDVLNQWFKKTPYQIGLYLSKPMLLRKEESLLQLNFDPTVSNINSFVFLIGRKNQ